MKHHTKIALFLAIAVPLLWLPACTGEEKEEPGSIAGFVVNANTGEPVRAANITLNPGGSSAISGSDGRYEFLSLTAGTYTVQATKSGYITNSKTVVVRNGCVGAGDIMLTPSSGDMSLSVSQVDFGTAGTIEYFQIQNNASNGSFQWSVVKQGAANWLTVSPVSGTTGAGQQSQITLTADRSQLTTSATVNLVVTNNTSGNSITLPVSISYNSGALQVSPNPVDFGTSASSRQLTLSNTGSTIVPYEINYNCSWLAVSPTSGNLQPAASATLSLALNRSAFSGLAETTLQVRNTADGSTTSVRVTASNNGGSGNNIVVANGLMVYYTFDNETANDMTDNGVDAQLMDGATIETDAAGRTHVLLQSFQGSFLNIPFNLFSGYTHWSVSFWVKGLTAGNVFAAQYNDNSSYSDYPMLWADQNGFLKVKTHSGYIDNNGDQISYNYSNNSGAWHHYVLLRDGGNGQSPVKFYVDGVLVDNLNIYCDNSQGSKIVFGGNKNGTYSVAPNMRIDNIRFYGRTLSTNEIQTIYNNEL